MKYLFWFAFVLVNFSNSAAQLPFIEQQMGFPKFKNALKIRKDSLEKQFKSLHLNWPPKEIYLRSFKFDSELEVWGRNNEKEAFRQIKTYKICALSGTIGPKRMDGDFQVPEGFYYINLFKPNSHFHMALGINYPNPSDQLLSDSIKPGSDIFIHGSCVTQGCIPIQNNQIEELYIIAAFAHAAGQEFIPVHIFPIRFNIDKDVQFINKSSKEEKEYQKFLNKMLFVFDFFEQNKKLPIIAITPNGDYQIY